jgi:hypothetical protein
MEVPLPWERLFWRGRSLLSRGEEYALTDFRLVRIAGAESDEIALQDIADIHRTETGWDRIFRASTLVVQPRRRGHPSFLVRHIRQGAQLAAVLELLAGDPQSPIDPVAIEAALAWEPPVTRAGRELIAAVAVVIIGVMSLVAGLHGRPHAVIYADDDAIYPRGQKRDQAEIMTFMKEQVLPWARDTLGPLKGGNDRISCETCHDKNPELRDWRMPAVAALPKPDLVQRGWETYSGNMDAQMRNAIYGYLAESDNQAKATLMREVVMPGMARLLHRPAYDFTRPYDYNRTRNAFGCYHCHRVR